MSQDDKIIELLEEILLWTKYDYAVTKQKMIEHLDNDDKKIAYQLSDGEKSTYDVAKLITASQSSVSNWWQKWFELELVEQTEMYGGGRYKRLISLTKMGILIPEIPDEVQG